MKYNESVIRFRSSSFMIIKSDLSFNFDWIQFHGYIIFPFMQQVFIILLAEPRNGPEDDICYH